MRCGDELADRHVAVDRRRRALGEAARGREVGDARDGACGARSLVVQRQEQVGLRAAEWDRPF